MKAMKNKIHIRYFFAAIIALSIFSFIYVNLHAAYYKQAARNEQVKSPQPVMMEDENDQNRDIPVPDISVLNRIYDIAQKFMRSNH